MDRTAFARVRALAGQGNVIPICREIPADCLTPVMAFLAASKRSRRCFLLESVEGGERIARYSFVGRDPYRVLTVRGRKLEEQSFLDEPDSSFAQTCAAGCSPRTWG